jgi:hypothetical protein
MIEYETMLKICEAAVSRGVERLRGRKYNRTSRASRNRAWVDL